MQNPQNINIQEENDLKKIAELFFKNYKPILCCLILSLSVAFLINRYSIPYYRISSSILIETSNKQQSMDQQDFLYSNMFGRNQNFQNELWVIKSYPIIEKTIENLDLSVVYYSKGKLNYYETYKSGPFKISYLPNHPQPLNIMFQISFINEGHFLITASSKKTSFYDFGNNKITHNKEDWTFARNGKFGELIETPDLAFIVEPRDTAKTNISNNITYGFKFKTTSSISSMIKGGIWNLQ